MTKHYNPSIVERANRILASKSGDFLSDEVQGPIATIAIEPVVNIVRSASSGTVYTTPSDKDFYLTGASLCFAKAAADTGTSASLTAIIDGVTQSLIRLVGVTLTQERDSLSITCTKPVKLDRNTAILISVSGTFSATAANIRGYTEEVTR